MKITAIIVDDEDLARAGLREYLAPCPDIELVAECANGFDAVKAIVERRPDLLLLDIQMPKLDGFEVLELAGDAVRAVIFVTAHDAYALRAFDVHAVDYLLKPVSPERFQAALERARERLRHRQAAWGRPGQSAPPPAELAASARPAGSYAVRLVVRDGARVTIIPVDALDYARAEDDYVALHAGGRSHLKLQTIAALEATLDPARFVRIHRSALVNLDRIARIDPHGRDGHVAVLRDGAHLPVSQSGYARLRTLWNR